MYCSICGVELFNRNQKFCHNCGNKISIASEPTKQKPVISRGAGEHTKLCFGFAMVSFGISIFGWILSIGFYMTAQPYFLIFFFSFSNIIVTIVGIGLVIMGLIFGILSKANYKKARFSESENNLQRFGIIFGILGIILNAIVIAIDFFYFYFGIIYLLIH